MSPVSECVGYWKGGLMRIRDMNSYGELSALERPLGSLSLLLTPKWAETTGDKLPPVVGEIV